MSMLMNLMVTGRTLVPLNHFGKLIWSIFLQKMPWIAVTVNGRFTPRNLISPPNFLGANAHVEDSLVVDGCLIDGTVKHSILSTGAQVREGAVVDSVIMSGAIVGQGAKIKRAIIG